MEPLEDRRLLAVFTVTNLDDGFVDSAGDAPGTLRQALFDANAAASDDVIEFDAELAGIIALEHGQLVITDDLTIAGLGAAVITVDGASVSRVFEVDELDNNHLINVTISGLTLTGGRNLGGGGAIFSQERLMLTDSVMTGNEAQWGGGVYNGEYGDLTVLRSTISGNTAISPGYPVLGSGGGIYNHGGVAAVVESTISGNMAPDAAGIRNIYSGNLSVVDSTISGNIAEFDGGGLHNYGSSAFILRTSFSANSAQFGAGIHNGDASSLLIEKSLIDGNMASDSGAGINCVDDSTLHLEESTISGNIAGNSGGGIRNAATTATILNSTLSENQAYYGGGLYVSTPIDELTIVRNSTISNNSAPEGGAGIYNFLGQTIIEFSTITENDSNDFAGSGVVSWGDAILTLTEIRSSIVAGNRHTDAAVAGFPNTFQSNGYNLIGVFGFSETFTKPGDQVIDTDDPLLGPLEDNGGLTLTHELLPGSLAIDAGDPLAVAGMNGVPAFDQRGTGFDRVVGTAIDIGAFELQAASPALVGDYNGDGAVNAADYTIWRDTLGSTTDLRANGNDSNSVIDAADYGVWTANFGETLGAGASDEERGASAFEAAQIDQPQFSWKRASIGASSQLPTEPEDSLMLLAASFVESHRDEDDDTSMIVYDEEDVNENEDELEGSLISSRLLLL
ncbi:MAG: right-handed parallel beta-helix repeat-containing protein [Pirellulales bacterium]